MRSFRHTSTGGEGSVIVLWRFSKSSLTKEQPYATLSLRIDLLKRYLSERGVNQCFRHNRDSTNIDERDCHDFVISFITKKNILMS